MFVSAFNMMLIFSPEFQDACRGLPSFSHSILDAQDLQDIVHYLKLSVKIRVHPWLKIPPSASSVTSVAKKHS